MKKLLVLLVLFTCLISCGNLGKTNLTDLDFRRDRGNEYVYKKDGTVFSGTAWSSDGKTVKIEVNNGVLTTVTVYHSNGKIAATVQQGTNKSCSYYDLYGNTITESQFRKQYANVITQIGAFEHEVHYIEE